jgi:hypothetical protein
MASASPDSASHPARTIRPAPTAVLAGKLHHVCLQHLRGQCLRGASCDALHLDPSVSHILQREAAIPASHGSRVQSRDFSLEDVRRVVRQELFQAKRSRGRRGCGSDRRRQDWWVSEKRRRRVQAANWCAPVNDVPAAQDLQPVPSPQASPFVLRRTTRLLGRGASSASVEPAPVVLKAPQLSSRRLVCAKRSLRSCSFVVVSFLLKRWRAAWLASLIVLPSVPAGALFSLCPIRGVLAWDSPRGLFIRQCCFFKCWHHNWAYGRLETGDWQSDRSLDSDDVLNDLDWWDDQLQDRRFRPSSGRGHDY